MAFALWIKDGPTSPRSLRMQPHHRPKEEGWIVILEAWHSGGVQRFATAEAAAESGRRDVAHGYLGFCVTPYSADLPYGTLPDKPENALDIA